jgi:tetratricopeptide (TPR) repeat protein
MFKMRKTAYVALVLILVFAISGFSQQPQWKTKAAYDAYNAAFTEKDPAKKAELAAKFLTDFKAEDISFQVNAYLMMTKGYLDAKNYPKAMEVAGKVDEALPNVPAAQKTTIFSYGMMAAQASNDVGKTVEFGEKTLAIAPDDANTLIILAGLIPERLPADDAGKKAALDKAEGYTNKAMTLVGKIFDGPKPANMPDADWNAQKTSVIAGLHSDLGLIALNRADYEKSVAEYAQVIKMTPKDPLAQFRLGLAYSGQAAAITKTYVASVNDQNEAIKANADKAQIDDLKAKSDKLEQELRAKRTQATDALATAVAIGGPVSQPATDQLKKLWTGTPEEMNALIASKKPQ